MERREFVKNMGLALLSVQILPAAMAHADVDGEREPSIEGNHLAVQSSGYDFVPHRHDLYIPLKDLENPPVGGVKIRTERACFHAHSVQLTQEQLQAIYNGETVEVMDLRPKEHTFRIYMPS